MCMHMCMCIHICECMFMFCMSIHTCVEAVGMVWCHMSWRKEVKEGLENEQTWHPVRSISFWACILDNKASMKLLMKELKRWERGKGKRRCSEPKALWVFHLIEALILGKGIRGLYECGVWIRNVSHRCVYLNTPSQSPVSGAVSLLY